MNLNTSQSTSFSIKSIYENFNEITQYKYEKSPDLREKIKKYTLEQIDEDNKNNPTYSKTSKNNNKFLSVKYNMNLNSKKSLSRLSSENYEKSNISNQNNVNKTGVVKRATLQFDESKFDSKMSPRVPKSSKRLEPSDSPRKIEKEETKKSGNRFFSATNKKRNSTKKRSAKRHESNREKEKTFYNQIAIKRNPKKKRTIEEKPEKEKKDEKMNYDKLISKNIEENQQNLNNPEEYFQGFFKDIISKRKQDNNNTRSEEKLKRRSTVEY